MSAAANTGTAQKCEYCQMTHSGKCPLVKAIEYHPNGAVKRVEFYEPQPITSGRRRPYPWDILPYGRVPTSGM